MRDKLIGLWLALMMLICCGKRWSQGSAHQHDSSEKADSAKELRIATQPAPLYGPIFVVKKKGWLEDELKPRGVTVKWSSFVAGPPENESSFFRASKTSA